MKTSILRQNPKCVAILGETEAKSIPMLNHPDSGLFLAALGSGTRVSPVRTETSTHRRDARATTDAPNLRRHANDV